MIRKQNSIFKTAFISDVNNNLINTDCFAHVELDDFACYVIADGIDDKYGGQAARLCVDSIISKFTESPSMSKKALRRYINTANNVLKHERSKKRLKASVMIIVHNYSKMRYAQAGNVKLNIYRDGFLKLESIDQSLTMDLVSSNKLPKDILTKHEERNNLYTYIGQEKDFNPTISKKIKLVNTDSIAIYTRGFWENVDGGEVLDIFRDASNDPKDTVDIAEDVLLSKQPNNLESYTFVTIFVEKIFIDPNKKRKIKKIIAISMTILMIILFISFFLWIRYTKKQEKIKLMDDSFIQTVEYILSDNYIKAEISCNKTIELAKEVKNERIENEATDYLYLIQNVIMGDDNLANNKYKEAKNNFKNALDRSRYTDKLGEKYILDKLNTSSMYLYIYDLLFLGDTLVEELQYDEAEQKYLEAKNLSSKFYFEQGRDNSIKALENLYSLKKDVKEKEKNESDEKLQQESSAVNFVAQGDKSFSEGDYESALVFYESALQKYSELEDDTNASSVLSKIENTKNKLNTVNSMRDNATNYINLAEQYIVENDYVQAKKYYLLAKNVYLDLKDDTKVLEINNKIEILDSKDMNIDSINNNSNNVDIDNHEYSEINTEKQIDDKSDKNIDEQQIVSEETTLDTIEAEQVISEETTLDTIEDEQNNNKLDSDIINAEFNFGDVENNQNDGEKSDLNHIK